MPTHHPSEPDSTFTREPWYGDETIHMQRLMIPALLTIADCAAHLCISDLQIGQNRCFKRAELTYHLGRSLVRLQRSCVLFSD